MGHCYFVHVNGLNTYAIDNQLIVFFLILCYDELANSKQQTANSE